MQGGRALGRDHGDLVEGQRQLHLDVAVGFGDDNVVDLKQEVEDRLDPFAMLRKRSSDRTYFTPA